MASNDTPKCVLLKGDPVANEAEAAAAITPGMFLELENDGTVSAHSVTGATKHPVYVARENEYAGGAIDDAYAAGDRVPYYACRPGDEVYALLETGQNVAIGALLASNAAGALEAVGANWPIAQALEAVNNASGSNARIKVRIL